MMMRDIIIIVLSLLLLILGVIVVQEGINDGREIIEGCKELGYDGVKFTNALGTSLECSNFTDAEKIKRNITRQESLRSKDE